MGVGQTGRKRTTIGTDGFIYCERVAYYSFRYHFYYYFGQYDCSFQYHLYYGFNQCGGEGSDIAARADNHVAPVVIVEIVNTKFGSWGSC